MPPRKRRVYQTLTEVVFLLAVAGLCSLALSGEKKVSWIRRPILAENLAGTPPLFQCMAGLVAQAGHPVSALRFSGPLLSKDRQTAWFFVYLGPGDAPYRLDFAATPGRAWRLFQYGENFDTQLGAFSGRMAAQARLIDRTSGKLLSELDLLPCSGLLGQGVGNGA